jgi:predicted ribosome-associated RNA-binding protein Tma20
MFRQPLQKKATATAIKGTAARRLRVALAEAFPTLSPAQLDQVWPKQAPVACQKLAGHDAFYLVDGLPLLFTTHPPDGAETLWPSLYLLHRCPQILPSVVVYDGVADKVLKGADLFMPGWQPCGPRCSHPRNHHHVQALRLGVHRRRASSAGQQQQQQWRQRSKLGRGGLW